ncbi:MAG: glycerate kinase [Thermoleophilia bacterium]|nr:glycerate kinase [Thermoleophilia bacterium]
MTGPVVVALAAFKGALSAADASRAVAAGVRLAATGVQTRVVPVADGGEGTLDALVAAARGRRRGSVVADPLGRPLEAAIGELPGHVAVVELAQASGYERLPPAERDPEMTSTLGTGEQILAALDLGATRIIVGLGGSATNDGGMGLARALGARFLDASGAELAGRGADLARVASVDLTGLDRRVAGTEIVVACDVTNPLTGAEGAAAVFGPQKGADPGMVRRLDDGLRSYAAAVTRATGVEVLDVPGLGAAGGAAAGLVALLGARIEPGARMVLEAAGLPAALDGAALCITGEGRLDEQSMRGKAPAAVAAACGEAGVPCVAVCGQLALLPGMVRRMGLAAAFPVNRALLPEPDALAETETNLAAMGAAIGGMWRAVAGF